MKPGAMAFTCTLRPAHSTAGGQIGAMDAQHHIRARLDQVFVATFERRSAEIGGGEVLLLQHGSHGPVEDEDAAFQSVGKGELAPCGIVHRRKRGSYDSSSHGQGLSGWGKLRSESLFRAGVECWLVGR